MSKMEKAKHLSWKYFGSMFMEPKGSNGDTGMSIGRFGFFTVLVQAQIFWSLDKPLPQSMVDSLMYLLAFICGTKGMRAFQTWAESKKAKTE